MTDFPFIHKKTITGAYTSFIFNKEVAKIIPFILNMKGILNVGGKKERYLNLKPYIPKKIKKNFNKKNKKISNELLNKYKQTKKNNKGKFIKF